MVPQEEWLKELSSIEMGLQTRGHAFARVIDFLESGEFHQAAFLLGKEAIFLDELKNRLGELRLASQVKQDE